MGIKDKLMGKESSIYSGKEKDEFPDDFKENTKVIKESEDADIAAFIRKKKSEDKPKEKEVAQPEPVKEIVEDKTPIEPIKEIEDEKLSTFAKIITIYMTPDKVDVTKEALKDSLDANFLIGLQAGIQVTKENVQEVSSILRYLADNKWLVVVSGEQVEPLFDATK